MLTRCPQCETIFRVSKKHISAAKGLVRCGSCKDVFNAKEHVIKSKKDLKTAPVTANASLKETPKVETTRVKQQKITAQVAPNQQTAKTEPDSFDFIKDGFISTGSYRKFDASTPPAQPDQTKKPSPKAAPVKQDKPTRINFDSVFEDETHSQPGDEVIIVKKTIQSKNANVNTTSDLKVSNQLAPASFNSQALQPQHSKAPSRLIKTGSFISQNVIDIKNAFSSLSKKLTNKVSSKIQLPNRDDDTLKESLNNKLNKLNKLTTKSKATSTITETTLTKSTPTNTQEPRNKPAVMSLNADTDIFSHKNNPEPKNTRAPSSDKSPQKSLSINAEAPLNKTTTRDSVAAQTSAPKVKARPKLKEDAALKLAIQLKKAALDKTAPASDKKTATTPAALKQKISKNTIQAPNSKTKVPTSNSKSELSITTSEHDKKVATTSKNEKPESKLPIIESEQQNKLAEPVKKVDQKTKTASAEKDTTLIAKEEQDSEADKIEDDSVQIHMQTGDIPMVLRESLEELDIPSRSIEMTLFMISSFIFLSLGLVLQLTVFRSIEMQQNYPVLKPLITKMCQSFTCNYSGPRDIKKIKLISRDIRVHPTTKGVLLITATIINNASYQQPYPNFSVKLSNLVGKTSAQRFFSPKDYLGKLSNKLLLMPPKQPIRVALEVVDPGKEAINFEFKFLSRK